MSVFDKVVADWLQSVGNDLKIETKQDLLNNMRESLELYRTLEDHTDRRLIRDALSAKRPSFVPGPTPHRALECFNLFRVRTKEIDFDFEDSVEDAMRRLVRYKNSAILFGSLPPTPPPESASSETQAFVAQDAVAAAGDGRVLEEGKTMQGYVFGGHDTPHSTSEEEKAEGGDGSEAAGGEGRDVEGHTGTGSLGRDSAHATPGDGAEHSHVDEDNDELNDTEDRRRRDRQLERPPRSAVSDISRDIHAALATDFPLTPKSQEQTSAIVDVLERHFLFSFLDDDAIARCAAIMQVRAFDAGTRIISAGDTNATLFLILSGHATATLRRPQDETETTVELGPGSTFGDLGIMYESVNDMTVVADAPVTCATIDRDTYKLFTTRAAEERRGRYVDLLSEVPFLAALSHHELLKIAEALKEGSYAEGDKIIAYGTTGHWLHLILHGIVDVVGRDAATGQPQHVATVQAGGFVGHLEFLNHHKSVADVIATTPVVRTARLSRHQFDTLIDDAAREPLRTAVAKDERYEYYRSTLQGPSAPELDGDGPVFDEPPSYLRPTLREYQDGLTGLSKEQPALAQHDAHDAHDAERESLDEDEVVVVGNEQASTTPSLGAQTPCSAPDAEHATIHVAGTAADGLQLPNDVTDSAAGREVHEVINIPADLLPPEPHVDLDALQLSPAAPVQLTYDELEKVQAEAPAYVTHLESAL